MVCQFERLKFGASRVSISRCSLLHHSMLAACLPSSPFSKYAKKLAMTTTLTNTSRLRSLSRQMVSLVLLLEYDGVWFTGTYIDGATGTLFLLDLEHSVYKLNTGKFLSSYCVSPKSRINMSANIIVIAFLYFVLNGNNRNNTTTGGNR